MQKNKKAVSQIVTTILIVLLVLAAIVIVWNVVKKTVTEGSEDIGAEQFTVSLSTSDTGLSKNPILVSVTRNAGAGNVTSIKIIFKDDAGNSYIYENTTDIPGELETITYSVNRAETNPEILPGTNLISFDVYPIIFSEGKEIIGLKATGKGITAPPGTGACVDIDVDGYNQTEAGCGVEDCDDAIASFWQYLPGYADNDADGYGAGSLLQVCSGASLLAGYSNIGDDCNDNSASINPGANEIMNNGVDENCDGGANLNDCEALDSPNTIYFLDNDVSSPGSNCFTITEDGILFDLKGHKITGDASNYLDYGISNVEGYDYLTIKNGYIYDFGVGIYSIGDNGNFTNLTITANGDFSSGSSIYGIYLTGNNTFVVNNNISNLKHTGLSGISYGIYIESSSNNTITNNTANSNIGGFGGGYGIYLEISPNNQIINNTANSNSYAGIFLSSSPNNNLTSNRACSNIGKDFYCTSSTGTSGIGNIFGNGKVTACEAGTPNEWPAYLNNYDYCP